MRSRAAWSAGWPRISIVPESGPRTFITMRRVVVLPAPFGPSSPNTLPRGTSRDRSFTATWPANALVTPRRRIAVSLTGPMLSQGSHARGSPWALILARVRGPGPGAKEAAETRGLVLVLVSAVAYGTLPILAKLAYGTGIRPPALLAARFAIASALFALLTRRKAPPWRERVRLWGLGLVFVTNTFTYFTALETVPAATVALLIYSYPVIVTLLAALAGLEILRLRSLVSAVLAFAGCALTASGAMAKGPGVVFALVTAVIYAVYIVLGSRFAAGVRAETTALHVAQVCAAAYVPWALFEGRGIHAHPWPWLLVATIAE